MLSVFKEFRLGGRGGGDREFIANDNPNKGPKAEGGS